MKNIAESPCLIRHGYLSEDNKVVGDGLNTYSIGVTGFNLCE